MASRHSNKRFFFTATSVAIALIALIVVYKHFSKHSDVIPSSSPNTNSSTVSQKQQAPSQPTSDADKSAPASNSQDQGSTSVITLLAPTGNFVSNHTPGNGSPTTEQSVCNTTPGATCYIELSKGGQIKTLAVKAADNSGSVIWSWDVADFQIDSGVWKITAISSLNGHTKSTVDSISLTIQ